MNELIEAGDPGTKVVGKRRQPLAGAAALMAAGRLNQLAGTLRERPLRVRKGICRFKTHQEADAWMIDLQIR